MLCVDLDGFNSQQCGPLKPEDEFTAELTFPGWNWAQCNMEFLGIAELATREMVCSYGQRLPRECAMPHYEALGCGQRVGATNLLPHTQCFKQRAHCT
ncbi:hypothetical protein CYMTET_41557 [Cymbomonas tetramitiformis]|uniref:Uncharacterized protein n=1 Tax=Cymbomonas tetramitiformis TaxID=36881 RepID=A0AAE0F1W4_9CHLO|nr:hypothetical protein CYMTET_41557 [Cymbomonas tetramitiformis]